jgi:hypothetical protein
MRKYTYIYREKEVLSTLLFQSGFSYNGHFLLRWLSLFADVRKMNGSKNSKKVHILDSLSPPPPFPFPFFGYYLCMFCRFYPGPRVTSCTLGGKTLGVRLTETTLISCARGKNDGVFKSNHLASSFDSAPTQTPAESTLEKLPTLHNHSSISYGTGVTKLLGAVYNLISCPRLFPPSIKRASLIISFPLHTFRNCVKLQYVFYLSRCVETTRGKINNK